MRLATVVTLLGCFAVADIDAVPQRAQNINAEEPVQLREAIPPGFAAE